MNNQEAKFILQAYRPSGADANDPAFREALENAKHDPTLGRWFEAEQAFDRAVAEKLRAVAPPSGLREAILAGARVSGARLAWWRQPSWMALAACVAIFIGVGAVSLRKFRTNTVDQVASLAIDDMLHARHGSHGGPASALVALLSNPQTRLGEGLPVDLETLSVTGCRTIDFAGHEVVEVCFRRQSGEFHFYVMGREVWPGAVTGQPRFLEKNGGGAAVWADAQHTYVLAGTGGLESLRSIL